MVVMSCDELMYIVVILLVGGGVEVQAPMDGL